jgi:hypothetical protein
MCKVTQSGYVMDDGTIIPFSKLKIEDLSVEHINELNTSSATAWDILLIRNSIDKIAEKVDNQAPCGFGTCKEDVEILIEEKIKDIPHQVWNKTTKFSDQLTKFLVLLLTLVNIYVLFFKG